MYANVLDQNSSAPSILIIDDTHDNIRLLSDCLQPSYEVLAANNGEKGLEIANRFKPDLILLDVMMPGLDGYHVCERLKAESLTADIPVIFLTALHEANDEHKGLTVGAVDFISKPFNPHVLISRIKTHLELKKVQSELHKQNQNLEDLVKIKNHELVEAHERLKVIDSAKQDFLNVISHELRTPVNGVLGFSELAFSSLELNTENVSYYEAFKESRDRLTQTLDNAMLLAELRTNDDVLSMSSTGIDSLLKDAITNVHEPAKLKNISFDLSNVDDSQVHVNEKLSISSLKTMLHAAIKLGYTDSVIRLKGMKVDNHYYLRIGFSGSHLKESMIESFFDVFSTQRSSSYVEELGLSIPLASRIMEAQGGTVNINNADTETIEINLQLMAKA